jgi:hypothetical protein
MRAPENEIDPLLHPTQVAKLLAVSPSWLAKSRLNGTGPRFCRALLRLTLERRAASARSTRRTKDVNGRSSTRASSPSCDLNSGSRRTCSVASGDLRSIA